MIADVLGEEERTGEFRAIVLAVLRRCGRTTEPLRPGVAVNRPEPCLWLSAKADLDGAWEPLEEEFTVDLGTRWSDDAVLDPNAELAWFLPSAKYPELDPAAAGSMRAG